MSEKRYTVGLQSKTIFDMKTELYLFDNKIICELLNAQNSLICEQQATITELERKLNKYEKIGEEQLKQIIDLQDELNECRARPTLATDERGVVKVEYR